MESIIILFGAIGFSHLLNQILLKFSKNFGIDSRQAQNIVRWSSARKPTTGGISFYITFCQIQGLVPVRRCGEHLWER